MGWLAFTKKFLGKLRAQDIKQSRKQEVNPGPNFTPRAQQVFRLAREEAETLHHNYVGTEHVLLGLIKLGQGVAINVFERLELKPEKVRTEVERQVGIGTIDKLSDPIPYTPRVKKALDLARREAKALHHTYIGTEHLFLGLIREGDGIAAQVLRNCGVDLERVRVAILKELDPNYHSDDEFYTRHFTQLKETAKEKAANQQSHQESHFDFTPRANQVLALARKESDRLNDNHLGVEHLLVGLIELGNGIPANVLKIKGMTLEKVRAEVERQTTRPTQKIIGSIPYTPKLKQVFRYARAEANTLNHTYIGTEHLLLGLLCQDRGPAADIFRKFGVDMEALHQEILKELDPNYNPDEKFSPRQFPHPEQVIVTGQRFPLQETSIEFTPRALQALALARKEADRLNDNYFGTEHLLVGLIELGSGVAANVLKSKGMTLEKVRADQLLAKWNDEKMFGPVPYTPRLKRVVHDARDEARALNHTYIGTEHLLLGLLREEDGPAAELFRKFGVDMDALRQEILNLLKPRQ